MTLNSRGVDGVGLMGVLNKAKTVATGTWAFLALLVKHGAKLCKFYRFTPVWMCTYPEIRALTEAYPKPGALLDVGANQSQFASLLKAIVPDMSVTSFEPSPLCNPIGHVHRVGLSDADSEGTLYWKKGDTAGGALTSVCATGVDQQESVSVRRFDTLGLDVNEMSRPILVKIDTQGHELRVVKGFGDLLDKVDAVVAEVQNVVNEEYDQGELFSYLADHGFAKAVVLHAHDDIFGQPDYMDVLWTKGKS